MARDDLWPAPALARLRTLWAAGHTGSRIAEELNAQYGMALTRSAVIGQAHRLRLPGRPSPIKRGVTPKRLRPAKAPPRAAERDLRAELPHQPAPAQPALRPGSACQWLEGEPRLRRFCGAACQEGSSYCPGHHTKAYTHKTVKYVVKTAAKRQAAEGKW